ncbi:MAG TPA: Rieske 2Fe-2S domain-containing protein [Polyangiaceae bacterium]|nr:Rieske 2Fe-2S domain-containing protein [Polyangiaceae bacterium]
MAHKLVGRVKLADIAAGELVKLPYPPFDVLVTSVDGVAYAIEDSCNHAGAMLTEGVRSVARPHCVVCPMHGYVFDLRTGELVAPRGLCADQRRFVTTIEGDEVVVWDPAEIQVVG